MRLEDAMEAIIDYRGKTPIKTSSGVPLVTAKIVKNGWILPPEEFIAFSDYDSWMRRGIPKTGDIVVTTEAPLGEVAQLDGRKVALAQRLIALRGKSGVLNNTFLKYLMMSSPVQEQLLARSTGTTVLGIKQSELRMVTLDFPPYPQQNAIADILGSLDDKIELNRRTNETLEAMAKAIFKSWFVEFDPVHAKSKGRQPDGIDSETAKLFPSSFENSEIGWVPKGWKVGTVGDLIALSRDALTPTQFPDEIFDHYSIPAFDDGRLPSAELGDTIKSNKFVVPAVCVLLSKLNPRTPRVWMPDIDGHRRALCSTEFLVSLPKDGISREFLFLLFTSSEFCERFATFVTGTSGSHQRVKPESLLNIEVVLPPDKLIEAFTAVTSPLLAATRVSVEQSRGLAEIRDAVLPRLLSGELTVPVSRATL